MASPRTSTFYHPGIIHIASTVPNNSNSNQNQQQHQHQNQNQHQAAQQQQLHQTQQQQTAQQQQLHQTQQQIQHQLQQQNTSNSTSSSSPFPFPIPIPGSSPYPIQFPSTGLTPKFPHTLALLPLPASTLTAGSALVTGLGVGGVSGSGSVGGVGGGVIGDLDDIVRGLDVALGLIMRCQVLFAEIRRLQGGVFGGVGMRMTEKGSSRFGDGDGVGQGVLDAGGIGESGQERQLGGDGDGGHGGQVRQVGQVGDGQGGEGGDEAIGGIQMEQDRQGGDIVMSDEDKSSREEGPSMVDIEQLNKLELVHLEYIQTLQNLLAHSQSSLLAPLPIPPSQALPPLLQSSISDPAPNPTPTHTPTLSIDLLSDWVERRGAIEFGRKEAVRAGAKAVLDTLKIDSRT
ncbi:hypothetical protein BCR39DRAFT_559919 [Naematelia encephala]|uniref:Uncharacterized protein n=1 Tax=Naematelia encephala TaxID=71784 RepID=A0A1Y2AYJ1_9TREE|nr:hypothetical protein BCR39DRAFT_559919 [Naematelia encephala]